MFFSPGWSITGARPFFFLPRSKHALSHHTDKQDILYFEERHPKARETSWWCHIWCPCKQSKERLTYDVNVDSLHMCMLNSWAIAGSSNSLSDGLARPFTFRVGSRACVSLGRV